MRNDLCGVIYLLVTFLFLNYAAAIVAITALGRLNAYISWL